MFRSSPRLFQIGILFILLALPIHAEKQPWWKHAVFYEIYPRSFADSNGDGYGDLNGITSRLDYLQQLGVDAIWITPFFPSPQIDFGYDVSDFKNIDRVYGSLDDFDRLVKLGKKRGIRVILDFVVNHTSDQHPWFKESASSRTPAKRDWYIWRDGKGPNRPPNNWISIFGGSAWQWDAVTGQYFYHSFYKEQPDLNWRNPAVKHAMFEVTSWWYKRGAAGFRLDAVDRLFEDPGLKDNQILPGLDDNGDPNTKDENNSKFPEVHDVLRGLRKVADKYDAVLVGETWTADVKELKQYYGSGNDELQMPMDLMFTQLKFSASAFREHLAAIDGAGGWPVYVIGNHDIERSWNRYGDGSNNDQIAKAMAALQLTLRGTPVMYYGEEIGMQNNDPIRKEDVKDPLGRVNWPKLKGRDGERTPMQWNDSPNAGFTTGKPWLPVPEAYKSYNVASELKDPNSILNWYKNLLALRRHSKAISDGDYLALNQSDANILSYLRRYRNEAVLVAINMSAAPQKVSFDLSKYGIQSARAKTLLTTQPSLKKTSQVKELSLEPFAVYIGGIAK